MLIEGMLIEGFDCILRPGDRFTIGNVSSSIVRYIVVDHKVPKGL